MKIADVTTCVATRFGVPPECIKELPSALDKIFIDGANALSNNPLATAATAVSLDACKNCGVTVACADRVIIGDKWEAVLHSAEPDNSVDIIALCQMGDDVRFIPIEGKLGMAFEYPGDRVGASLTLKSLEDKYQGCSKLLGNDVHLLNKLIVVVPSCGQQWMWYKIRGWNLRGNKIGKVFSCCVSDLLSLLGCNVGAKPAHCAQDVYRTQLLRMEFEKIGAMSKVQLPPHDSCVGCGKCRDACRDEVRKHAIAMIPDEAIDDEPLRPFIDEKSCVGCRVCEKHCPILNSKYVGKVSDPSVEDLLYMIDE